MTDNALITGEMLDTTSLPVQIDVGFHAVIIEPPLHAIKVVHE